MIAYSIYKNHRAKKDQDSADASAKRSSQPVDGTFPQQLNPADWQSHNPPSYDQQVQGEARSANQMHQLDMNSPNRNLQQHSGKWSYCPVCRQDKHVLYSARDIPNVSIFASCSTCETTWKCQCANCSTVTAG